MPPLKRIQEALLSAYPSRSALAMMLRFQMDVRLDEVAGNAAWPTPSSICLTRPSDAANSTT